MSIKEQYPFVTVWKIRGFGINERCTIGETGYIGKETGNTYSFETHYHSDRYLAVVKGVSISNETGMYHLDQDINDGVEENNYSEKLNWIKKHLIVEEAHYADGHQIYRSVFPIFEYWSDMELNIIEKI